jgi:hypothetical protein
MCGPTCFLSLRPESLHDELRWERWPNPGKGRLTIRANGGTTPSNARLTREDPLSEFSCDSFPTTAQLRSARTYHI